jgi:potassium-transporting ATPase KdpC subunit
MISLLIRQAGAALRLLLVAVVVLGLAYPFAVWGVSRLPGLHGPAEGSLLSAADGTTAGSSLIGIDPVPADPTADPWFHTRPSASATDLLGPGNPSTSGGSNKGGFSDELLAAVQARRTLIAAREGVPPAQVPPDAVTASGSGVDPHITPAYADLQVARVARVTGLPEDLIRRLVAVTTNDRGLGFLGDPGVDVTRLNLAIADVHWPAGTRAGAPTGPG